MRRFILSGTLLILVAAIYFSWQHRFERSPGFPTIRLSDLRSTTRPPPAAQWIGPETRPTLRLRVDPAHPRVVAHLELPGMQAVDLLHLRFQLSASRLKPGKQLWDDGRCIIEWHPPAGGGEWENNLVGSARHDQRGQTEEWVTRPDQPPAIPALRVENRGTSGDFELSVFEATVVRETLVWKIGRWLLMAAWLAWAMAWIGTRGGFIRSFLAASIWLVMGIYFVVPGPWKLYHSFGSPFQIGKEISSSHDPAARLPDGLPAPPSSRPMPLDSVGEIPDQGDFTLRLKHYAANARPLLHIVLLWGPTLLIACLVGGKPAYSLAVIFALATEAAQLSFGYGFDWIDIFDLVCDATGIVLALVAHRHFKRLTPMVANS